MRPLPIGVFSSCIIVRKKSWRERISSFILLAAASNSIATLAISSLESGLAIFTSIFPAPNFLMSELNFFSGISEFITET